MFTTDLFKWVYPNIKKILAITYIDCFLDLNSILNICSILKWFTKTIMNFDFDKMQLGVN